MAKKEKSNKIRELEIRLLENSLELSKFNYHIWVSMYLASIALIFLITQLLLSLFNESKVSVFIGGIVTFIVFSIIMSKKIYSGMRNATAKYEILGKRFEKLGVDLNSISKDMQKELTSLPYWKFIKNRLFYGN